jgi:hypothetical protein
MPKALTDDQRTLRPVDPAQRILFTKWDQNRDVITFVGFNPKPLSDDWSQCLAVSKSGIPLTVRVRRADCGSGCRCAGEYEVLQLGYAVTSEQLGQVTV